MFFFIVLSRKFVLFFVNYSTGVKKNKNSRGKVSNLHCRWRKKEGNFHSTQSGLNNSGTTNLISARDY